MSPGIEPWVLALSYTVHVPSYEVLFLHIHVATSSQPGKAPGYKFCLRWRVNKLSAIYKMSHSIFA